MLKIAVCDDDAKVLAFIKEQICEMDNICDFEVETDFFRNGEDLFSMIERKQYDIICLDIVMGKMNGVETARKIRAIDRDVTIIFMSSYDNYLRELFPIKATAFIDKPIDPEKFKQVLRAAFDAILENSQMTYTYTFNKITKWVYIREICYFENNAHLIIIHLKNGTEQYYETMTTVWNRVKALHKFIMPSISFIINIDFIDEFQASTILMKNGETVPISRRFQKRVSDAMFENIKEWS